MANLFTSTLLSQTPLEYSFAFLCLLFPKKNAVLFAFAYNDTGTTTDTSGRGNPYNFDTASVQDNWCRQYGTSISLDSPERFTKTSASYTLTLYPTSRKCVSSSVLQL